MGPSQTSKNVDEMLAQLVSTGSTTLEGLMATDHKLLDQTEDLDVDESNNRIDGAIFMQHGKYTVEGVHQRSGHGDIMEDPSVRPEVRWADAEDRTALRQEQGEIRGSTSETTTTSTRRGDGVAGDDGV